MNCYYELLHYWVHVASRSYRYSLKLIITQAQVFIFWFIIKKWLFVPIFYILLFFKDFVYLFFERGEGREEERERNINVWLPLVRPYQGPGPQSRHVPWPGSKPTTLLFTGWHPIHWVTSAGATFCFFLVYFWMLPMFQRL